MKFYGLIAFVIIFISFSLLFFIQNEKEDISIGLLYSKTGTMSSEESSIAKILYFGVKNLNQKGGINGQKIKIIEYDGKSDSKEFAKGAEYLTKNGVKYIFGCWTSSARKAVKPIIEKNNALLFYPVQYEGAEESKNIIYLGETPNQQINPVVTYIKEHYGNNIFIVGSDYIYPRLSGIYLERLSKNINLNILGQSYHLLGSSDFTSTIEQIKKLKPDAIINTLNGSSNTAFFKSLYENNITSNDIPVFSMSIDENSLSSISSQIGNAPINGHYAAWSYFNSINNTQNTELKKLIKDSLNDFILTNASYNTYLALQLWEKALKDSNTKTVQDILNDISRSSLKSINGVVYIDKTTLHMHKPMRIGKILNKNFNIVWHSNALTHPAPYSDIATKEFWNQKVTELYKGWNNSWQSYPKGELNE